MKCPKCQKEMTNGYIPASKVALVFVPSIDGKMPKTIYGTGKGTIQLTKIPFWKMQKAEAYFCSSCDFIIMPVKDLD